MSKRTKYTRREALAELRRINIEAKRDCDYAHSHWEADNVLINFLWTMGYRAIVKEFERLDRRYT